MVSAKTKAIYYLKQLLKNDNTGSYATRYDRERLLITFVNDLNKVGYKGFNIKNLKGKHIEAIVNYWKKEQLGNATIKNRLAAIRHFANLINKSTAIPTNSELKIEPRKYVSATNRALKNPDFSSIADPYLKISLELQRVFGLRREESLKIKPILADKGDQLMLSSSWCKGGRARVIPIRTDEQRYWLECAKEIVKNFDHSLIPQARTYIQQRYLYDKQVERAGLRNLHGLRHAYAQARYKELTGWEAPINGGPHSKALSNEQKGIDYRARMILTEELGHSRTSILTNYCG